MVLSVYLWHSEGLSERNRLILEAAGEAIETFGGAWMLAGDFNMTPEDLQRWRTRLGPEARRCQSTHHVMTPYHWHTERLEQGS